jgi:hypothetical protein
MSYTSKMEFTITELTCRCRPPSQMQKQTPGICNRAYIFDIHLQVHKIFSSGLLHDLTSNARPDTLALLDVPSHALQEQKYLPIFPALKGTNSHDRLGERPAKGNLRWVSGTVMCPSAYMNISATQCPFRGHASQRAH